MPAARPVAKDKNSAISAQNTGRNGFGGCVLLVWNAFGSDLGEVKISDPHPLPHTTKGTQPFSGAAPLYVLQMGTARQAHVFGLPGATPRPQGQHHALKPLLYHFHGTSNPNGQPTGSGLGCHDAAKSDSVENRGFGHDPARKKRQSPRKRFSANSAKMWPNGEKYLEYEMSALSLRSF